MITYKKGDLLANLPADKYIYIPHITNNTGKAFHEGFVKALNQKWPFEFEKGSPQWHYLTYTDQVVLGKNQYIKVEQNITVVNMCAQDNVNDVGPKRCRYGYLAKCMISLANEINSHSCDRDISIYAPMFGSGIGGGDWSIIEELIEDIWHDLDVTIFSLI